MPQANDHVLLFVVIGAYLAMLLGLGLYFRKLNKDVSDYFRGGCRATWWLAGVSVYMAGISANTFTGNGGAAYEAGWSVFFIYIAGGVGSFLQAIFLAHLFRQTRAYTYAEIVRDRFGPITQQIYAVMGVFTFFLMGAVWLWSLAIFVASIFGISTTLSILLLGGVVMIYSTVGGAWAVMANDYIQGIIMIGMAMLLAVLCLYQVGGVGGLLAKIQAAGLAQELGFISPVDTTRPDPYQYTSIWATAITIFFIFNQLSLMNAQRFFSVKTGRDARLSAVLCGVLMIGGMLIFFIPPITARLLFAQDVQALPLSKPAEGAYAVASMKLLPQVLVGVMVVAMFSATTSSMDTALNRNAAFVVRDIWPAICRRLRRNEPDERKQMRIGQLTTLVFGVFIVLISLYYSTIKDLGVFEVAMGIGALIGLPMGIPMVMGIFIRKTPLWSALFATMVALIPSAWSMIDAKFYAQPWPFHQQIFTILPTGILAFAITRLFWRTTPLEAQERNRKLFERMYTPVDFEKEVGQANDRMQLQVIGTAVMIVASFVMMLALIPQSWTDRGIVAILSGSMYLIGIIMLALARRNQSKPGSAAAGSSTTPA